MTALLAQIFLNTLHDKIKVGRHRIHTHIYKRMVLMFKTSFQTAQNFTLKIQLTLSKQVVYGMECWNKIYIFLGESLIPMISHMYENTHKSMFCPFNLTLFIF